MGPRRIEEVLTLRHRPLSISVNAVNSANERTQRALVSVLGSGASERKRAQGTGVGGEVTKRQRAQEGHRVGRALERASSYPFVKSCPTRALLVRTAVGFQGCRAERVPRAHPLPVAALLASEGRCPPSRLRTSGTAFLGGR
jgi:hypothetical protein